MDICQIGYDICEFDSLRGLGIDIIGKIHFDNRERFAIWMGSIGKATEPCQPTSGYWHLTLQFLEPWHGRWYEYDIFIASCTDNIYDLEKMRGDCWGTWLIMMGFVDLGWPRVCRCSTSVLFHYVLKAGMGKQNSQFLVALGRRKRPPSSPLRTQGSMS